MFYTYVNNVSVYGSTVRLIHKSMFQKKKMKLPKHRILSKDEMPEVKERKSGIIYFQTLPPNFTVSRMRDEMSKFGEIGRIYLQVNFLLVLKKH